MKYFIVIFILLFLVPSVESSYEGTLIIPSISLYKSIDYEPLIDRAYDLSDLEYGVARLEGTSWDDPTWGRTVLVGHTPGGFQGLTKVKYGDRIILLSNKYTFEYSVNSIQVVEVSNISVLSPTELPTLTLITCYGQQRLVISAYLKDYHVTR